METKYIIGRGRVRLTSLAIPIARRSHPVCCQWGAHHPTVPMEAEACAKAQPALPAPALPAGRCAGVLRAGCARLDGSALGQSTVHGGAHGAAGPVLVPQSTVSQALPVRSPQ